MRELFDHFGFLVETCLKKLGSIYIQCSVSRRIESFRILVENKKSEKILKKFQNC